MKVRESWGEGNPLAGAQGVPFPPSPPSFPNALFSGGWSGATTLPLSPRQPSPGNTKKRTSRSLAKRQQRIKQKKPAGMAGFCYVRQNRLPKKSVVSAGTSAGPAETGRPPSRIPRSVASRRTRHKEGTTRLPILRLRVRAKHAAATEKEPATPHESETPQCPSPGHRGTVGTRKATTAPRRLILQSSAFWGRRGEFEGGGNTLLRAS